MDDDDAKRNDKDARSLRWRAKANQALGRMTGDDERRARGRTQETLADVRDYTSKLAEKGGLGDGRDATRRD